MEARLNATPPLAVVWRPAQADVRDKRTSAFFV